MKTTLKLLLAGVLFLLTTVSAAAQTTLPRSPYLKSAKMFFLTPNDLEETDNKDHDTRIKIEIFGVHGFLSSVTEYNEDKEFPDDGSTNVVDLVPHDQSREYVLKPEFEFGRFKVTIYPVGNDDWIFTPTLKLYFSDGTSASYTADSPTKLNRNNPIQFFNFGGYSHP